MNNYADLSLGGQIRRLRALAHTIMTAYDLVGARLTLIKPIENATFRVVTPSGQRYCLRIHPPGRDTVYINSEMVWLDALTRDAHLRVPEPLRNRDGAFVTIAGGDGVGGPRSCVMFHWVEGRFIRSGQPVDLAKIRQAGAFLARLHRYAERWTPPSGFRRDRYAAKALRYLRLADPNVVAASALLTSDDAATLKTVRERIETMLQTYGQGRDVYGLIHGDFVPSNYMFHRDEVCGIDFDDCMYSYYMLDIALALRAFEDKANYDAIRSVFLDGYRSIRLLDTDAYLDTFLAMSHLMRLDWVVYQSNQAAYRDWAGAFVSHSLHKLRRYANSSLPLSALS